MLGNTVTIAVSGSDKVLSKINQDAYSSEYMLRGTTGIYRLRIRNTAEKALMNGKKMDRHNAEFTFESFPDTAHPQGYTIQAYVVLRNPTDVLAADVDALSDGLADFVKSNAAALVGWES